MLSEERYVHLLTFIKGTIAIYVVVKFDRNDDMACEGQSTAYECMEFMLQTLFERDYNLEKDADSSMPMEMSTPQEKIIEEESSSSKDESKYLYDHNENYGIEEEISSSRKEEVKEILRSIVGKNEQWGRVLNNWWKKVQHDDEEVIQNMNFSMGGFLQA
ncbi:hypothetical protein HAX54_027467 [Datura stramonium]|uniref:Uncharacterized protein n=1 Tax=Datura stramonium TaxID=4076 RepID=A0ABS8V2E1_DATST|nr:hypothetical protein [Datura stramonium]